MSSSPPRGAGRDCILNTNVPGRHCTLMLRSPVGQGHLASRICDSCSGQHLLVAPEAPSQSFSGSLCHFSCPLSPSLTSLLTTGCCDIKCCLSLGSAACTRAWKTTHPLPAPESHPQGPVAQPASGSAMPLACPFLLPPRPLTSGHLPDLSIYGEKRDGNCFFLCTGGAGG